MFNTNPDEYDLVGPRQAGAGGKLIALDLCQKGQPASLYRAANMGRACPNIGEAAEAKTSSTAAKVACSFITAQEFGISKRKTFTINMGAVRERKRKMSKTS